MTHCAFLRPPLDRGPRDEDLVEGAFRVFLAEDKRAAAPSDASSAADAVPDVAEVVAGVPAPDDVPHPPNSTTPHGYPPECAR
ncbi:hypothetical protein [Frankia sp. R82]|uniref:hypothetical protein n=1 Tax=Frankia sp. R82 TaxID=2950553 RepID=UPI002042C83B|nr:hypothetical protein [Frankia sp. R82]MCM3885847.1 hypothetical protein [Frankia sp. R82]